MRVRMRRPPRSLTVPRVLLAVLMVLTGAPPQVATAGHEDPPTPTPVTYLVPVPGGVVRGFEPPAGAYGPGHRGVDLAALPGEPVRAAADGRVAHAGAVAGTTWVSLDHADGVRTAYGPLRDLTVARGDEVAAGGALGRLAPGGHGHLGADEGLHFSARREGVHVDPMGLFSPARPSLVGPGVRAPQQDRDPPTAFQPEAGADSPPRPPPVDALPGGPLPSQQGSPLGGPIVTPITHVR